MSNRWQIPQGSICIIHFALICTWLVCSAFAGFGGPASLVKDINANGRDLDSDASYFGEFGNNALFLAADKRGRELWISDGSAAGTQLVVDLNAGETSGANLPDLRQTKIFSSGGIIYFSGNNGSSGDNRLFKSDGTIAGTVPLGNLYYPVLLGEIGGKVFFAADDGIHGKQLWSTDGTETGTMMLPRVNPADGTVFEHFAAIDGSHIFYWAETPAHLFVLMSSDGMTAGTQILGPSATIINLFTAGPLTFFVARRADVGEEIWRSDGTPGGTFPIDVTPGPLSIEINKITPVGDTAYFTVGPPYSSVSLWKSDGSVEGTVPVQTIFPPNLYSRPTYLYAFEGHLFYIDDTTNTLRKINRTTESTHTFPISNPTRLIRSDNYLLVLSTENSDAQVQHFWEIGLDDVPILIGNVPLSFCTSQAFTIGNRIVGTSCYSGPLWVTDGTASGTGYVEDLWGLSLLQVGAISQVGDFIYFQADDGVHGVEPWRSDGTAAGTFMLKNINTVSPSDPGQMIDLDGKLIFTARPMNSMDVYASDGTEAGTKLIFGGTDQIIESLTRSGPYVFFYRKIGNSYDLYRTDGTASRTIRLVDISEYSYLHPPPVDAGGQLIFGRDNPDTYSGIELWRSDGTVAGTEIIRNFQEDDELLDFTKLNNEAAVFISSRMNPPDHSDPYSYSYTINLWKTDGTTAGTEKIGPDSGYSYFRDMRVVDDKIYFSAVQISPFSSGLNILQVGQPSLLLLDAYDSNLLGDIGDILYFNFHKDGFGDELWRTDATLPGTYLVKDIRPGVYGGLEGTYPVASDNIDPSTLIFAATTPETGREFWKTNGTEQGTVLVRDVFPGPAGSLEFPPSYEGEAQLGIKGLNGAGIFAADNAIDGLEPWRTDGTFEGTFILDDIYPGTRGSEADGFTVSGDYVYFAAEDYDHGRELWKIPLDAVEPAPSGRAIADFDNSGCIDLDDFFFILDNWQTLSEFGPPEIGISDFLALLDNWRLGPGCP